MTARVFETGTNVVARGMERYPGARLIRKLTYGYSFSRT